MNTLARRTFVAATTLTLGVALAIPASARQRITYRGETSQSQQVQLLVVKKDGGARTLRLGLFGFVATSEDTSAHNYVLGGRREARCRWSLPR